VKDPVREYKTRARHCIDIAADLDGARRLVLLEMAKAWMLLAEQAARNQRAQGVHEAPAAGGQKPVTSPDQPDQSLTS
jgi:hypothetical protein